ncbi:MAG: enoyl-CoA hydratase [Candidatus Binataceae bacterium]
MSEPETIFTREPPLAVLTLNRPRFHNALTWAMYDAIVRVCGELEHDEEVRVLIVRGAGDRAFASGTDIAQFEEVRNANDGLAYERRLERAVGALEGPSTPTIAAIEGYAVGGGAALALVCDLRYGSVNSKIGVPIARTVGNCLSTANYARLLDLVGPARTLELLYRAQLITAATARELGLLNETVADGQAYERARQVGFEIAAHAPLTLRATKRALRRLQQARRQVAGDDLIAEVYGSEDFREGVRAFAEKRRPHFRGH